MEKYKDSDVELMSILLKLQEQTSPIRMSIGYTVGGTVRQGIILYEAAPKVIPRVAYIECDDTMACRDLVEAIENGIGLPKGYGGTIWSRVNRIREFFNTNEGFLLIIDEADKLINKYTQKKMEILRGIFDQSNVGIVIAGEPRLETELKGNLARFANRMDFYYKLKGLSKNEVVDYLEGYEVDEAAMGEMISRATNTQEIYVLEEGETILSLNKYGDLWEAETIAIPWIHHSQEVEVQHSKYSGIVTVEKTIVRSDDTGAVHMYIYFAGGEKDV